MSAIDILFNLPKVLSDFGNTLLQVLTTKISLLGFDISLWGIIAGAGTIIVVTLVVYSIVRG